MINTRDFFIFLCTCGIMSYNYAITASHCGTDSKNVHFEIVVKNILQHRDEMTYETFVVTGGILLGGMRTLMETSESFKFTYHEDRNYGPFLDSVNGVSGSSVDHTYWELLVQKPGQEPKRLDVGIGCYIPEENDRVIFNFTKFTS